MTFTEYLISKRQNAEKKLTEILTGYENVFTHEPWANRALSQLKNTIPKGKLIRYTLTQLAYEGYGKTPSESVEKLGIVLELVHTGLLFQDDIMDNDKKRRGNDASHIAYARAYKKSSQHAEELGKSLAICTSDFAFFIAFDIISQTDLDSSVKNHIHSIISREFARVSLAQMQDNIFSQTSIEPTREEIIEMYKGKTGRYSIALPLVCGAIIAGSPEEDVHVLWSLGETLGILYQIRDDALSLFGNNKKIGKPVGSDIIQNKKTLYRQHLIEHADTYMKTKLLAIFGNPVLSEENQMYITDCLKQTGTMSWIDEYGKGLSEKVKADIPTLTINASTKDLLLYFLSYIGERNI